MTLGEIAQLLGANVVCGEQFLGKEVEQAFASDLMSDVLTINSNKLLLITGLLNIQTIRTAEMSFAPAILFVRNKKVTGEMIRLAQENDLLLMEFPGTMFKASGILYNAGIKPVY